MLPHPPGPCTRPAASASGPSCQGGCRHTPGRHSAVRARPAVPPVPRALTIDPHTPASHSRQPCEQDVLAPGSAGAPVCNLSRSLCAIPSPGCGAAVHPGTRPHLRVHSSNTAASQVIVVRARPQCASPTVHWSQRAWTAARCVQGVTACAQCCTTQSAHTKQPGLRRVEAWEAPAWAGMSTHASAHGPGLEECVLTAAGCAGGGGPHAGAQEPAPHPRAQPGRLH